MPSTDCFPASQASKEIDNSPASSDQPRSILISRNITINNHRTSVRLEPEMWAGLREICRREHASLHTLCTAVAERKPANSSLTAAIRVFIMAYFRAAATEDGHSKAGHGPGGYFMSANAHKKEDNSRLNRSNRPFVHLRTGSHSGSKT